MLHNGNMPVIDMSVCNDMDQLTGNQAADLCKHVDQNGILHHIPVIGCQHILTALIQNGVQYLAGDIECHGIGTGVKMHVVEVF